MVNEVEDTVAVHDALPSPLLSVTVTVPSCPLTVVPSLADGSMADGGAAIDRKPKGSAVTGGLVAVPVVAVTVTVTVYVVPSVSPVSVHDVAVVVVQAAFPGDADTVYPLTVPLLTNAGAVHETAAVASPALAARPVGACGATNTSTLLFVPSCHPDHRWH